MQTLGGRPSHKEHAARLLETDNSAAGLHVGVGLCNCWDINFSRARCYRVISKIPMYLEANKLHLTPEPTIIQERI